MPVPYAHSMQIKLKRPPFSPRHTMEDTEKIVTDRMWEGQNWPFRSILNNSLSV